MLPGTNVTIIPAKSSVWCVLLFYHRGLSVINAGIMASIAVTCLWLAEIFSETEMTQGINPAHRLLSVFGLNVMELEVLQETT